VVTPVGVDPADFAAAWSAPSIQLQPTVEAAGGGLVGAALDNEGTDLRLIKPGPGVRVVDAVCYAAGAQNPAWPDVDSGGFSIYVPPGAPYTALGNDTPAAWAASDDGVDGAYASSLTAQFDGVSIGSPGHLETVVQGACVADHAFDANQDGVLDLSDLAHYTLCLAGVGIEPPLNCACFDHDFDDDVDLADFAPLQAALAAP
ncbi:MAG TPA: hypothetical protein P5572_15395, partial [Phycisphaerae bacterium]|nr:hypothetical protein [Phycisphaerae bacterium]